MIPFQLTDCNQRKILTADVCQILKDLRSLAPIGIQINHRLVWRGTFEYIYSFLLYRKRIHSAASPPLANAPQAARVRISCTCAELLIFTTGTTILLCLYRIRNQHKSQLCFIYTAYKGGDSPPLGRLACYVQKMQLDDPPVTGTAARRVPSSHKQYCTVSAACFWRSCKKQQHARTAAQVQTVRACFTLSERANASSLRSGDSCRR